MRYTWHPEPRNEVRFLEVSEGRREFHRTIEGRWSVVCLPYRWLFLAITLIMGKAPNLDSFRHILGRPVLNPFKGYSKINL